MPHPYTTISLLLIVSLSEGVGWAVGEGGRGVPSALLGAVAATTFFRGRTSLALTTGGLCCAFSASSFAAAARLSRGDRRSSAGGGEESKGGLLSPLATAGEGSGAGLVASALAARAAARALSLASAGCGGLMGFCCSSALPSLASEGWASDHCGRGEDITGFFSSSWPAGLLVEASVGTGGAFFSSASAAAEWTLERAALLMACTSCLLDRWVVSMPLWTHRAIKVELSVCLCQKSSHGGSIEDEGLFTFGRRPAACAPTTPRHTDLICRVSSRLSIIPAGHVSAAPAA